MHKADKRLLDFVKGFESFVPYPYDDLMAPVGGKYREWTGGPVRGTLTIGYGHTNAAKHPLKLKPGLRLSEADADEILDLDLDECEEAVNRTVKVPITQGQFNALVSFAFNCGTGSLANIVRRVNAGHYAEARAAFDLYVKSKGVTLRGLQRRRDGEQAMWDERDPKIPTEPVHHTAEVDEPRPEAPEIPMVPAELPKVPEWHMPRIEPRIPDAPPTPLRAGFFMRLARFLQTGEWQ